MRNRRTSDRAVCYMNRAERWRSRTLILQNCEIFSEFVSQLGRNLRFGLIGAVSSQYAVSVVLLWFSGDPQGSASRLRISDCGSKEANQRRDRQEAITAEISSQYPGSVVLRRFSGDPQGSASGERSAGPGKRRTPRQTAERRNTMRMRNPACSGRSPPRTTETRTATQP